MRRFLLAPGLLQATARILRSYGTPAQRHEGVAFWAGNEQSNLVMVTHVLAPQARTGPGFWKLTDPAAVGKCIRAQGTVYLGQVHSHPPLADATHSGGDDEDAYLKFEGMVSVVVGNYAERDDELIPLEAAGVHLFEGGVFRLLPADEVRARFSTTSSSKAILVDMRRP